MKKLRIIGLIFLSIIAITILLNLEPKDRTNPYNFRNPEVLELFNWVHENITYKSDLESWSVESYNQTPEETLKYRTGDCEDYARLFNDLIYYHLSIRLPYAIIHMLNQPEESAYHMVLYWEDNDSYIDPTFGDVYKLEKYADRVVELLTEEELKNRTMNEYVENAGRIVKN